MTIDTITLDDTLVVTLDDINGERWALLDDETRAALKAQAKAARTRMVKTYDPLTGETSLIEEDAA